MLMSLSRSCRVSTPTGLPSSKTNNASHVLSKATASAKKATELRKQWS